MTKKEMKFGTNNIQSIYLSSLSLVFLVAFISYYAQFQGLVSSSGIEPVARIFPHAFPKIHIFLEKIWKGEDMVIGIDSLCECFTIVGVVLSCIGASGIVHHGLLISIITILYHFLVTLGGTFYSFQWDILLIETGFLTSLCYAPWLRLKCQANDNVSNIGSWPLQFLLFKLMFMSGVVKIQAECPTWINLTALEYHFATQCLPNPFAWYAHQLHPFLLRLSVAITLLIEICAAFLVLSPFNTAKKIGASLQILLMVMIFMTGNYNYFNLLTIILCLPCLREESGNEEYQGTKWLKQKKVLIESFTCCGLLLWAFVDMFDIEILNGKQRYSQSEDIGFHINIKLDSNYASEIKCNEMINRVVPITIWCSFAFLCCTGFVEIWKGKRKLLLTVIHLSVSAGCLGYTALPFMFLTPQLGKMTLIPIQTFTFNLWQSYRISSSYGLFRQMTGVGHLSTSRANNDEVWGWGNMPPSIVERPEIILEGLFTTNKNVTEWRELNFRWKPGNLTKMPMQLAPYQPRLDWQMWFAALGSYQNNPWFVHLVHKLLQGCDPVINLLDEPQLASESTRLVKIRANLYNYDFTRFDSSWNQGIPGTRILDKKRTKENSHLWWTRVKLREYLPPLERSNPSVSTFLSQVGYDTTTCSSASSRCNASQSSILIIFCSSIIFIRENGLVWFPIFWLLLYYNFSRFRKKKACKEKDE